MPYVLKKHSKNFLGKSRLTDIEFTKLAENLKQYYRKEEDEDQYEEFPYRADDRLYIDSEIN